MDDLARVLDEDRDQETPGRDRPTSPPTTRRRSSSPRARPASRAASSTRSATWPGQRLQAEHWFGARDGERRLVHGGAGLVEVDPQRLHRALADGRGRRPPRRPLRPRRAAAALRGARRQRPLPGADRVPDAGQARRAARRSPALRRLVSAGEPIEPEVIRALPRATRPRRSATATARPRPARSAACARTRTTRPRRLDGPAAARARDPDRRRRAAAARRLLPHLLRPLPRRRAASRASGGRPATGSARTRTATSGSRAAATT